MFAARQSQTVLLADTMSVQYHSFLNKQDIWSFKMIFHLSSDNLKPFMFNQIFKEIYKEIVR